MRSQNPFDPVDQWDHGPLFKVTTGTVNRMEGKDRSFPRIITTVYKI